jgi:glycosyltransferase involved in cell wall biosynthesis
VKILVLNYEFPPVGGGGGQASADLCGALAARGHEVRLVTTRVPGLARKQEIDGTTVLRVFTGRRSRFRASFLAMAGYLAGAFLPALRLARTWKPDLIHAHFAVPTGALANRLSRLTRIPYVLTAHLGDVPGGVPEKTGRWFRRVYRFTHAIWREASAVVAVSEHTRQLALEHYPVAIEVIPNGVALPDGAAEARPVSHPPALVFVGRFQPQKNLGFLIDLLDRVRDLPWGCTLVGDGPTRGEIEASIRQKGLADRVSLTGWVSPEEAARRLAASDLLVMPSLSEGLPVVGVRALAFGLALLVSQAGGLAELVEDGVNGRSCPIVDRECFERALRWCLEDSARLLQMKQASRSLAARYDIRTVAADYEAIFARVAAQESHGKTSV